MGGGVDNGGWVVGPVCCDVFHLCCPQYTAETMGRIIAKWSLVPPSLGVHPNACDVCVVCGVSCVVCVCVCVWGGVGWWEGGVEKGKGCGRWGINNGGWVLRRICCDVWTLGCPKYTAKPMGRIVAK